MKMPKVDDFLCCMKLETGGLVIGWFNAFFDALAFISCAICIVLLCVYDCDDLSNLFKDENQNGFDEDQNDLCAFGRGIIIAVAIILALFSLGFFVIAYFCIRGTHRRNHFHIKPIMVLMAILSVLSFLEILQMKPKSIGSGALKCIFYAYQFVVTYSLYCKFQEEYERGLTAQYVPTTEKV